jgi:hypothetical protein
VAGDTCGDPIGEVIDLSSQAPEAGEERSGELRLDGGVAAEET